MACSGNSAPERLGAIFLNAMDHTRQSMIAMCPGAAMAPGILYYEHFRFNSMHKANLTGASSTLIAPPFVALVPLVVRVAMVFDKDEPADHALGRSKGGFGTKLHLLCDAQGLPLSALLLPSQAHESTQFEALLETVSIERQTTGRTRKRPQRVAADKAY